MPRVVLVERRLFGRDNPLQGLGYTIRLQHMAVAVPRLTQGAYDLEQRSCPYP